jgi:putative phosphoesterase
MEQGSNRAALDRTPARLFGGDESVARFVIGLIADTHGLIRPESLRALTGSDVILHAGDVGGAHVLDALRELAPVHAVAGNVDSTGTPSLAGRLDLTFGETTVHVSHGHELGSPTPLRLVERYDADVVVYGHTHRPCIERIGRQLVVNPGSAGPARFHLMPSVARLVVEDDEYHADLVALVDRPRRRGVTS